MPGAAGVAGAAEAHRTLHSLFRNIANQIDAEENKKLRSLSNVHTKYATHRGGLYGWYHVVPSVCVCLSVQDMNAQLCLNTVGGARHLLYGFVSV